MIVAAPGGAAAKGHPPAIELADIFQRHGESYRSSHRLRATQAKAMHAIEACRTPTLGGHRQWCPSCGFQRYSYHSCRNRHCPKCQSLAKAAWLEARRAELLPVSYFHNVFTLPHELNPLILYSENNQRRLLKLLFHAAAQTLLDFGKNNLAGKLGFTMVLHTWDQLLKAHFHVHCLIPAGALATDGSRWISTGDKFLFHVKSLSKVFRGKYLDGLKQLIEQEALDVPPQLQYLRTDTDPDASLRRLCGKKAWVVYSKRPFDGPHKLLDYLGRYVHRVAISNHRLISMDDRQVRFWYRDRRDGDCRKVTSLPPEQFIRRFLQHVLPDRFMRVRHFGFLANRTKKQALALCREHLRAPEPPPREQKTAAQRLLELTGEDTTRCPRCQAGLYQDRVAPVSQRPASAPRTGRPLWDAAVSPREAALRLFDT